MDAKRTPTIKPEAALDWPLYWFARIDGAIKDRDDTAFVEAQSQLARLGISVVRLPSAAKAGAA